ncbi:hypothetical protein ACFPES_16425 [Paenibacillus sp. GCM10023248]|uniref:hypothetical protein n=1 Tax=unclassified Paenibacillus TaxID=185978 RepID=UPI0023786218|nr:hypothetical protein [Paenibacillus sp. MAHUQ-63]MDD9268626.1 hypothetical protein [Paenibacillus sp. MAHUQ-63]
MDFLKDLGKLAGHVTGKVLGGTVRVAGELVRSDYIKEIGNDVEQVTAKTGEIAGHAASGVWDLGAGLITTDKQQSKAGLHELEQTAITTARGIGHGIEYVVESGKDVVTSFKDSDKARLKDGLKKLGKAAAISILAIGVIDIVDGPDVPDSSGST